jgi:hypothetical protein
MTSRKRRRSRSLALDLGLIVHEVTAAPTRAHQRFPLWRTE